MSQLDQNVFSLIFLNTDWDKFNFFVKLLNFEKIYFFKITRFSFLNTFLNVRFLISQKISFYVLNKYMNIIIQYR